MGSLVARSLLRGNPAGAKRVVHALTLLPSRIRRMSLRSGCVAVFKRMKTKPPVYTLLLGVLASSAAVRADVVTDWNAAALDAIRVEVTPPPQASRNLAILHASIFD